MKHWSEDTVQELQLAKIWKWLWSMQLLKTVICFRWLLIHYALLVGDWLRQHQRYACGLHCGSPNESILHVFSLCPKIKRFWSNLLLLLSHHYSRSIFSCIVVQYCGESFMERLWCMKVRMFLMFFVFLMDTLSHLVSFFYSTIQN